MRVAVLGLGLIGGSVALALAEAGHEVVGYDTDPQTRAAAATRITVARRPEELRDAAVAVLAVPVAAMHSAAALFESGPFSGVLTDTASVKGRVLARLGSHPRFVGGHPMAGKAEAGFAAAEADLFRDRPWVLCLEPSTDLHDWVRLAGLWTSIGARVVPTTAAAHDRAAARISHVEHIAAAALTAVGDEPLARSLAAGSFRDGTRVAASPPLLFQGMVEGNRDELAAALGALRAQLESAQRLLEEHRERPELIADWFARAHRRRSSWPDEPGGPEPIRLHREDLLELGACGGWIESVAGNEHATVRRPRVESTL